MFVMWRWEWQFTLIHPQQNIGTNLLLDHFPGLLRCIFKNPFFNLGQDLIYLFFFLQKKGNKTGFKILRHLNHLREFLAIQKYFKPKFFFFIHTK